MANGAHCRFQNTLVDLRDCHEHLGADLSEGEARARTKLLELCQDILADAENMGLIDPAEVIGLPETGDFPRDTDGVLLGPIAAPMPVTDDVLPIRMMDGDRPIVVAYIDGACSGNPGPGGWGVVVLKSDGSFHEISGSSEGSTTNNRMELQAAIELLSRLPAHAGTFVYADSQYVIKGMTEWLAGWKKNGWRTSAKKEVQNTDLWLRLEALAHNRSIGWHWVRGHNGHPANERADQLAVAAIGR